MTAIAIIICGACVTALAIGAARWLERMGF
jgi:hypothetical protein